MGMGCAGGFGATALIVAFNTAEGWVRDVSGEMAREDAKHCNEICRSLLIPRSFCLGS